MFDSIHCTGWCRHLERNALYAVALYPEESKSFQIDASFKDILRSEHHSTQLKILMNTSKDLFIDEIFIDG